ncbi:MauE/DoxX family redox-associated membrane protein [Dictyobacter alpinus]|uniref:MauE/DoxX family redox-associated membrane protein n=1 Tax=Dictyobacter alpinus TaxID=2014873 RepID=UPI000F81A1A4|nr:MauE/DoxX family redox-associated membrane protein [Dictyobacter alpinus]
MIAFYFLAFGRVVIGLVFTLSSMSKILNISQFRQTILDFQILPPSLSNFAAFAFLCGEISVVFLVAIGGAFLLSGLILAILLLLIFCGALAWVLRKKRETTCNCFGASTRNISFTDIWRNVGFLLCATGGCELFIWTRMPTFASLYGACIS